MHEVQVIVWVTMFYFSRQAFSPDENELMRQFRLLMLYGRK